MFKKILIANRGEIALRINRTAQRMGIRTVAVYSDADKYSPHVRVCDEAVRIGPPPVKESYLVIDRLIAACKETGADAVHPGYGFLSEKADFARALEENGITFIGPRADTIGLMGDKIEANRQAREAGVPTIPGHWDSIPNVEEAARIGAEIGFPVMLKAAAGGGGKGMRVARNEAELKEAFRVASGEALTAFGDDRVFIEKLIVNPRHIEIQVLADQHGHVVHLGERECSIQRRHQKVIEEAPSPFVTAELRREMGERAVALAKSVEYRSAGTIEFVTDPNGQFYFLEMNTRLQVEHSVTEFTSGLDLVEWMIRIAAGEPLDIAQSAVEQRGWSLEARVYAEDPNRGFLPSTGRLVRYRAPEDNRGLRVDSGVYEGAEISMFYDPMIAKVTTWERDRATAIESMRRALDDLYIKGVRTNVEFLAALMANPRFLAGDFSTHFVDEEYPNGFSPAPLDPKDLDDIIAVAALMHLRYVYRATRISGQMPNYGKRLPMDWMAVVNGEFHPVMVSPSRNESSEEGFDLVINNKQVAIRSSWQIGDPVLDCTVNAKPRAFTVELSGLGYRVHHLGAEVGVIVYRGDVAELAKKMPKRPEPDLSKFLMSPMPGQLKSLSVSEGENVNPGDELAIVEAMKMENALKATQSAQIAKVLAKPGEVLSVGQVILEFH